jgi:hypothetical protein
MIRSKSIRLPIICTAFFVLPGCSKSTQKSIQGNYTPNTFTFTIIDTIGIAHIYSDTTWYNPDNQEYFMDDGATIHAIVPHAHVSHDPGNQQLLQYSFLYNHPLSNPPTITALMNFSLPYFQASSSAMNNNLIPAFSLSWGDVSYMLQTQGSVPHTGWVYLTSFTTSTNISDSTGNFLTGSFDISATTVDSAKIIISGKFSHMPGHYGF